MAKKKESLSKIKAKKFFKNNSLFVSFLIVLVIIALAIVFNQSKGSDNEGLIYGDDVVDMYYFYLSTCPHCHEQEKFHKTLVETYPMLRIHEYEMTSPDSVKVYKEFATKYGGASVDMWATPTTFIGNQTNVGFGTAQTTGKVLINMIESQLSIIRANWTDDMKTTQEIRGVD